MAQGGVCPLTNPKWTNKHHHTLKMNNSRNLWLFLLLITLVYHFSLLYSNLNVYDEGTILTGAERVKNGEVPYRDFWTIYPPGQFYALGGWFKLFGSSLLAERIYDLLIRCFLSIMPFLISRKLGCNLRTSVIAWGMAMLYLGSFTFFAYPVYPALLFIFLGIYYYLDHSKPTKLLLSGASIGIAALFRHDLALFAGASLGLTILIQSWKLSKPKGSAVAGLSSLTQNRKRVWSSIWKPNGYFLIGLVIIALPCAWYFIELVGWDSLIEHLVTTPAEIIPNFRSLPYPSPFYLEHLQFYIFPGILLTGMIITVVLMVRFKMQDPAMFGFFSLFLIGILVLNQVRVRSDTIHLLPAGLLAITVTPAFFQFIFRPMLSHLRMGRLFVTGAAIVISLPFLLPFYQEVVRFNPRHFTMTGGWSPVTKSGVSRITPEMVGVVQYIQSETGKNEPIYVGTKNHDQFVICDAAIYFLSNRPPATRYHELHPGVTSTPVVQKAIISDLEAKQVQLLVLAPRFWEEPNQSRIDTQTELLDQHIQINYVQDTSFGVYEIWRSR